MKIMDPNVMNQFEVELERLTVPGLRGEGNT
jgi:hypothetical protein